MYVDVHDCVKCCMECAKERPLEPKTKYRSTLLDFAFHTISIDVVGLFTESTSGCKFLIVAIDKLTKWVEAVPVASATARVTAKFILHTIIFRHGCPQKILTDNGTNFTARVIPVLNQLLGVRTHYTTPYHPQANGIVERVNGTLGKIIRKLVEHTGKDWDVLVPTAVFAYNISFHQTTGYSPFKLLFGREPATPSIAYPLITGQRPANTEEYVVRLARELIKLQTLAFENLAFNVKTRQDKDNLARKHLPVFQSGDKVYFYANRGTGRKDKLSMMWNGPAVVKEPSGLDCYLIKDANGHLINRIHASHLERVELLPVSN